MMVAHGVIGGVPAVAAVFDFGFMGGSMGTGVGDALVRAARLAETQDAALLVFPSSGGARMQEGILSLMQMPRTVAAVDRIQEKGLPFIVVLTDPTNGGVTAHFALPGTDHPTSSEDRRVGNEWFVPGRFGWIAFINKKKRE